MASDERLDEFARGLVNEVRDDAIRECDRLISGQVRGLLGERWNRYSGGEAAAALRELIPDIVDQALFQLLDAVDNDRLPLGIRGADGSWISLSDLGGGEMGGYLMMGKGGWLDRYSSQRWFDPFA